MNPIRVLLVDDNQEMLQTLSEILSYMEEIEIVGYAQNGKTALELCPVCQPDVILMDVNMPIMNGVEATELIHRLYPAMRIVALSSFQEETYVRAMLLHGAVGYIVKGGSFDDMVSVIRAAYAGQAVLDPQVLQRLLHKDPPFAHNLSDRELTVLKAMSEGQSNQEIANGLSISVSTVRFHIQNVLHKLKASSRAEAIVTAARANLL